MTRYDDDDDDDDDDEDARNQADMTTTVRTVDK